MTSELREEEYRGLPAYLELTPLHRRVASQGIRSSRISIPPEEHVFVDVQDVCNWTPLHWAASQNDAQLVKDLLDLRANTTLRDLAGFTAAHYACRSGRRAIVEMFIAKGVRLDIRADNGLSPMDLASLSCREDIVETMMRARDPWKWPLYPELSDLQDFGGRLPVHWAAAGGSARIVMMLKGNVDAQDHNGFTPLHIAVLAGQNHLIKVLVKEKSANGEVRDMRGHTPLVMAGFEGKWEAVEHLVNAGVEVDESNSYGMTALHYLAADGASPALISTLTKGLNSVAIRHLVNLQDQSGRTPLHLAATRQKLQTVKGLLEAQADVRVTNRWGETPLLCGLCWARTDEGA